MQLKNYLKSQIMYDKAVLENCGTLKSVCNCFKNQEMYNKAIDNYLHALEFVPECFKSQKNVQQKTKRRK